MKDNNALTPSEFEAEINLIEKHGKRDRNNIFKSRSPISLSINKPPLSGYGRCRSCECKGYISKHNGSHECKNCNHHFDRHN